MDLGQEVDLDKDAHQRDPERARAGGPVPIKDGCVLDHLGLGPTSSKCWEALRKVRTILGWSKQVGSEGVYSSKGNPGYFKGILTLPGFDYKSLRVEEMKMMASVAPGCTFNCVNDSKVVAKYRLQVPERIYNLPNISCKNSLCVSNPVNRQREIVAYLERESEYLYVCKWCRWPHVYENIWDDLRRPGESTRVKQSGPGFDDDSTIDSTHATCEICGQLLKKYGFFQWASERPWFLCLAQSGTLDCSAFRLVLGFTGLAAFLTVVSNLRQLQAHREDWPNGPDALDETPEEVLTAPTTRLDRSGEARAPETWIILLAFQRSGTHWLTQELSRHPCIYVAGASFLMKVSQGFLQDLPWIKSFIAGHKVKLIWLQRHNMLRRYLSMMSNRRFLVAATTDQSEAKRIKKEKVPIPVPKLLKDLKAREEEVKELQLFFKELKGDGHEASPVHWID
eukprot:g27214.t1